jgi:hypothetical protein
MALLPNRALIRKRFLAEWPQIVRIVIAAVISWEICKLIDTSTVPVFAVVAPLIVMRDQPFTSLNLSFDRLIGVIVGVLLGIVVVSLIGVNLLSLLVVLVVGLLTGVVLRLAPTLNIQVALTGLLVFTSTDPSTYGLTRLWETLIGAAVTVVLSPLLFPPDVAKLYRAEFRRVSQRLGEHTAQIAVLVEDGARKHEVVVALLGEVRKTDDSADDLPATLEASRRAVRNNPLRRHRIGELDELEEVTGTVVETGRWLRVLTEEIADLSGRRDVDPRWATTGPWLSRVLRPVAAVIDATLVNDPSETGEQATVAESLEALSQWRQALKHPIDVILRRSSFRLVRTVGRLAGEEISQPPWVSHVEDVIEEGVPRGTGTPPP